MGLPADASGAYRPNPQATTKLAPRPSSLKGYLDEPFFLDKNVSFLYLDKDIGQSPQHRKAVNIFTSTAIYENESQ
jgi:hypothetical protein